MSSLCFMLPEALAQGISKKDIHYSIPPDESRTMDLYIPNNAAVPSAAASPPPVILWIHGGGWIMGDKSTAPATELLGHGYAVASINYRFATQARFPAQLDDCLAAVSWLKAHAGEFHVNANDMAVIGESSGGHLAALLGTMPGNSVKAVITLGAPTDLSTIAAQAQFPGQKFLAADGGQVAMLLGTPARKNPELALSASPVKYASRNSAPFLILAGTLDQIVPIQQSVELNDRLKSQGAVSELIMVPGAGHAIQGPDWQKPGFPFLDKYLNYTPLSQQPPSTPSQSPPWSGAQTQPANPANPFAGRESPHDRRARRRALRDQQNASSSGMSSDPAEPGVMPANSAGSNEAPISPF
ncbi:MAG TPA: alpha/beta hydrolase, partial [Chroococcales cyanobacterium]